MLISLVLYSEFDLMAFAGKSYKLSGSKNMLPAKFFQNDQNP